MSAVAKSAVNHKPSTPASLILEAWSEGFMGGALTIMGFITLANMRRGVWLHKLIFVELLCALPDCFAMFISPPTFGWYLSTVSTFLISSWTLHNVIAWIKNKPFLSSTGSWAYIGTVVLVQPFWILQIVTNFLYFNRSNELYVRTRPLEPLFRDPWWIFTTISLFWNIKYRYEFGIAELIRASPRLAILLSSMALSIIFIVLEVLAVTKVFNMGGLNPFWRLSLVFKCFTDTIILDDFKTALDKLSHRKQTQLGVNQARSGSDEITAAHSLSQFGRTGSVPCSRGDSLKPGVFHIENVFRMEREISSQSPV